MKNKQKHISIYYFRYMHSLNNSVHYTLVFYIQVLDTLSPLFSENIIISEWKNGITGVSSLVTSLHL